MIRSHKSTSSPTVSISTIMAILAFTVLMTTFCPPASATPVSSYRSFAGNYDFVVTGGTFRTGQCTITSTSTATLSGVPANGTTTVQAAYLYWAGSGSADTNGQVSFEGNIITNAGIDRNFIESAGSRTWFGGFEDVTTIVRNKVGGPNGNYTFSGLDVVTTGDHCSVGTVLAGWGLIVIYEDSANEPLRVINIFDGLQNFWGSSITLTPSNFQVPSSNIDGKFGVLTWEGDNQNLGTRNGLSEELRFNGTPLIQNPINPAGNQYNSTIGPLGATNVYGVDLDVYDVSATLTSGDTSATTFYSTGQDRVLLMMEVISVTNTPVADLSITKSHGGNFITGLQGIYTIRVTNNGPVAHTGQVRVTDTLPAGLTYASASGTNWSCGVAGQVVTCTTNPGSISDGASLPAITLTVDVDTSAAPSVTNTATVESLGTLFDNNIANNSADDPTDVFDPGPSSGTKQLYFYMDSDTLQRTVNNGSTLSGNIAPGSSYSLQLSPVTQSPLTISAGNIPVSIWLRRTSGGNRNHNITVALDYFGSSTGSIGSQSRTIRLRSGQWRYHTFNINLASDTTLDPNTTIRATITHEPSSSGNIDAQTLRNGNRSQIALATPTVINVDRVDAYSDVPFPGGVVQATYGHNANIRIRAVVSDPFGHNDITSAIITIIDPNNNSVVTDEFMTEVAPLSPTPPAATKTYEYPYTIPAAGPNGTWTVMVTANEGSEGTISDQGMGTFVVAVMPNIMISKSVTTILKPNADLSDLTLVDPDAYAIPGAIMRYDIVVTNTGVGPATVNSIEISDLLPAHLKLVLNNPIAPAVFIDGDTYGQSASGLSFTRTDVGTNTGPYNDIALSNDGGTSFLLPGAISQTARGVDSTSPKINYIRINPKGTFAGSTGGPDPSFTIQLRLVIE